MFFEIAFLVAGAIATGLSINESRSAQRQQQKAQDAAYELQRKQEQFKIQQLKKQAFERGRIVRAQSLAAQTNSGAGSPDSSAIGGAFSVTSQANANIGNLNAEGFFQDATGDINDIFAKAASAQGRSNAWGGAAQLSIQAAGIGRAMSSSPSTTTTPTTPDLNGIY